ncbi:antA/AntB antirepressor family protein [Pasteurellaceae bacterium HPA106]|uniref:antA/AntB antirepressor family protein n=1 Tax=Spirabiliibacterium pneumoniae TaxID=221400 RepID=UPI001AADDB3F|nr:antA/AntB antirepressor family protein [Spirabiliibacterium pneumoniae]MBE2896240.1 antA/AntB antirepressor family protein [Spirabiliibacterium pneumoniae]
MEKLTTAPAPSVDLVSMLAMQSYPVKDKLVQGVNARNLHKALQVGRDYSNWIKGRIDEVGFLKEQDYITVQKTAIDTPKRANQKGGNLRGIEYIITPDMAKHLCLLEKTPMGRIVRQHFIDAESTLRELVPQAHKELAKKTSARLASVTHQHAMTDALKHYYTRQNKAIKAHHYSNESEMLDSLVLGQNVRQWKSEHSIKGNVRDYFTQPQLEALNLLQTTNTALINLDMNYHERKGRLSELAARTLER